MSEENTENTDVEWMTLYEVSVTYGEDRNNLIVQREQIVSEQSDEGRVRERSKLVKKIPDEWDMDYVSVYVNALCNVRVKAKPREILAK